MRSVCCAFTCSRSTRTNYVSCHPIILHAPGLSLISLMRFDPKSSLALSLPTLLRDVMRIVQATKMIKVLEASVRSPLLKSILQPMRLPLLLLVAFLLPVPQSSKAFSRPNPRSSILLKLEDEECLRLRQQQLLQGKVALAFFVHRLVPRRVVARVRSCFP